jgi:AGZA family xanthine/uracil permease-like MFS transporter
MSLKHAVTGGIGLFIAFIGLQNAQIIVEGSKLVGLYSFKNAILDGSIRSVGVGVILALVGILITGALIVKGVKGNILWGILITWGLGIILELTGVYVPNAELSMYSTLPDFSSGLSIPSLAPTFAECFRIKGSDILSLNFLVVVFSFLFVDLFDTLGTLIGVATKADMLDEEGRLPNIKGALLSDAVATSVGAVFGTSTTTTFVESAAGVAEGGRTGLTAITSAALFLLALFFSPIFLAIPSFATAPALIIVGFLMIGSLVKIDFSDVTEGLPAFICFLMMPLAYSISEGIAFGFISYVVINLVGGKAKEKKISVLMYVLAVLFILKYIFIQT